MDLAEAGEYVPLKFSGYSHRNKTKNANGKDNDESQGCIHQQPVALLFSSRGRRVRSCSTNGLDKLTETSFGVNKHSSPNKPKC